MALIDQQEVPYVPARWVRDQAGHPDDGQRCPQVEKRLELVKQVSHSTHKKLTACLQGQQGVDADKRSVRLRQGRGAGGRCGGERSPVFAEEAAADHAGTVFDGGIGCAGRRLPAGVRGPGCSAAAGMMLGCCCWELLWFFLCGVGQRGV